MPPTAAELNHIHYDPSNGLFYYSASGKLVDPANQTLRNRVKIGKRVYRRWQLAYMFMGKEMPDRVTYVNGNWLDNSWDNLIPHYTGMNWRLPADHIRLGEYWFEAGSNVVSIPRYHVYVNDAGRNTLVNQPFAQLCYAMIFRDRWLSENGKYI